MPVVQARPSRRLTLHDVDWQTYTRLLRAFEPRRGVRLAYDRGVLEIVSPLYEHEMDAELLGRMVVVLTEELDLPIQSGGSTTFRRRAKQRGIEPDNCFWIANEPRIRGKRRIDLRSDPPPDLAIEVDVTSSSLDRMGIYADLRVAEVWRLDNRVLTFHRLRPDGTYRISRHSLAFPFVMPDDLTPLFGLRRQLDENSLIARFRQWVRQRATKK